VRWTLGVKQRPPDAGAVAPETNGPRTRSGAVKARGAKRLR
jgi:hypothetical protein